MFKKIISFLIMGIIFSSVGFTAVMTPNGKEVEYYGRKDFHTKQIQIEMMESALKITIWTNYSISKHTYNVSDIQLKISEKDSIGIKMSGINKGDVLYNPQWKTSEIFKDIKEYCRNIDGSYIRVLANGGRRIGRASINEETLPKNEYKIIVIIPKKYLDGISGFASWGTALCGNSLVTKEFSMPKEKRQSPVLPYNIDPSFTNNNPVVPYWTGPSYYPNYWTPWGIDYPFWDGDGGGDKPIPPPVPVPKTFYLF